MLGNYRNICFFFLWVRVWGGTYLNLSDRNKENDGN